MADNPALIVRVAANVEELKKGLTEGKAHLETTTTAMQQLAGTATTTAPQITTVGTVAAATAPNVDRLHGSLTAFDSVLAALGIHLGPEIRGLGELGNAAGKTTAELGAIATVGLAVGAAIGGWKIGRAISDFFDLDQAIGNATARLLGWGDAAGEAAGANAEALARASERVGFAVTNMADALLINGEAQHTFRSNAQQSADAVARWHGELEKVKAGGEFESLTADIASQNFPLKELAQRYHVSVEALQLFTRETAAASAAEQAQNDIIKAHNATKLHALQDELAGLKSYREAMDELNSSGVGWKGTLDTIDGTIVEAIKSYLAAGVSQKALADAYGLTATQIRAVASARGEDLAAAQVAADAEAERRTKEAAYYAWRQSADDQQAATLAAKAAALDQVTEAATNAKVAMAAMSSTLDIGHAARDPVILQYLKDGWSLENAMSLKMAHDWGYQAKLYDALGNLESQPSKAERVPGYAGGIMNAPGGWADVGERGPERMYVPPGANIYPSGSSAGSGGTQIIQLVVDGRVLASVINDRNTKTLRQSRQWPSA